MNIRKLSAIGRAWLNGGRQAQHIERIADDAWQIIEERAQHNRRERASAVRADTCTQSYEGTLKKIEVHVDDEKNRIWHVKDTKNEWQLFVPTNVQLPLESRVKGVFFVARKPVYQPIPLQAEIPARFSGRIPFSQSEHYAPKMFTTTRTALAIPLEEKNKGTILTLYVQGEKHFLNLPLLSTYALNTIY